MALNPDEFIQRQSRGFSVSDRTEGGLSPSTTGISRQLRVCENCIRKKVKCDQKRPACSRCSRRGETCEYSSQRRRPGPQPGSYRRATTHQPDSDRRRQPPRAYVATQHVSPAPSFSEPGVRPSIEGSPQHAPNLFPAEISSGEQEQLVQDYFDILHDVNPIHSKEHFLRQYRSSLCDADLISAIVSITVKLTRPLSTEETVIIDTRLDSLLTSSTVQFDLYTDYPCLDQYRKACVLAIYEFHQFPGHQSWVRIGTLTRMAFRIGLDRLEILRQIQPEWSALSAEDFEEWRAIWWCIYRLDSYSNLSLGTPYLVNEDLIVTALGVGDPSQLPTQAEDASILLLPTYSEKPWELVPIFAQYPDTMFANIHNLAVMMIRRVARITRIAQLRLFSEAHIRKVIELEQHLSALRLALPTGWLHPKRNALSHESHNDHHARLVTNLFLLFAQLLLAMLFCARQNDEDWLVRWQRVLAICQDIAAISEQWDSLFCVKVDPAISFIIFVALIFLDLHEKSSALDNDALRNRILHDKTVLRLQLEQFASIWTLPKLLNLSYKTFSETVQGPITAQHIRIVLLRFEAPLHPRWLHFLTNAQDHMDLQRDSPLHAS